MEERTPATDDEARALASTLRLRIMRICLGAGSTNKEIAQILGRNPASILHHVRTLVRTGFLEQLQERPVAGGGREGNFFELFNNHAQQIVEGRFPELTEPELQPEKEPLFYLNHFHGHDPEQGQDLEPER